MPSERSLQSCSPKSPGLLSKGTGTKKVSKRAALSSLQYQTEFDAAFQHKSNKHEAVEENII